MTTLDELVESLLSFPLSPSRTKIEISVADMSALVFRYSTECIINHQYWRPGTAKASEFYRLLVKAVKSPDPKTIQMLINVFKESFGDAFKSDSEDTDYSLFLREIGKYVSAIRRMPLKHRIPTITIMVKKRRLPMESSSILWYTEDRGARHRYLIDYLPVNLIDVILSDFVDDLVREGVPLASATLYTISLALCYQVPEKVEERYCKKRIPWATKAFINHYPLIYATFIRGPMPSDWLSKHWRLGSEMVWIKYLIETNTDPGSDKLLRLTKDDEWLIARAIARIYQYHSPYKEQRELMFTRNYLRYLHPYHEGRMLEKLWRAVMTVFEPGNDPEQVILTRDDILYSSLILPGIVGTGLATGLFLVSPDTKIPRRLDIALEALENILYSKDAKVVKEGMLTLTKVVLGLNEDEEIEPNPDDGSAEHVEDAAISIAEIDDVIERIRCIRNKFCKDRGWIVIVKPYREAMCIAGMINPFLPGTGSAKALVRVIDAFNDPYITLFLYIYSLAYVLEPWETSEGLRSLLARYDWLMTLIGQFMEKMTGKYIVPSLTDHSMPFMYIYTKRKGLLLREYVVSPELLDYVIDRIYSKNDELDYIKSRL